jgi:hypothetical protein
MITAFKWGWRRQAPGSERIAQAACRRVAFDAGNVKPWSARSFTAWVQQADSGHETLRRNNCGHHPSADARYGHNAVLSWYRRAEKTDDKMNWAAMARWIHDTSKKELGDEHVSKTEYSQMWVVLAASLKQDAARCGASLLLLSPVVVTASRLLFGRRFVRSGPSPAFIATGDVRAMRAARVRHGRFSPPQSSTDVARVVLSSPLFFSRSVAPRAALP